MSFDVFFHTVMDMSRKILLTEDEIPKHWYNILPDLPKPLPPAIDPSTKEPIDPKKLEAIFPRSLIQQELSQER